MKNKSEREFNAFSHGVAMFLTFIAAGLTKSMLEASFPILEEFSTLKELVLHLVLFMTLFHFIYKFTNWLYSAPRKEDN
ncbi:hypothetical protein M2404_002681 [Rheinheimera pacifica]|uniref:hypothetical protein n=1 Tax=Rheinheimera pacifica TaxID=173990 RepID=UPI002168CC56|nr:hypothetical protein [Rheinheimera pacifica]MCS4308326.1 hypothetical protein [Rheinheimera pacifica]